MTESDRKAPTTSAADTGLTTEVTFSAAADKMQVSPEHQSHYAVWLGGDLANRSPSVIDPLNLSCPIFLVRFVFTHPSLQTNKLEK